MFISSPSHYRHEKKGRQKNNFVIVIVNENNTATVIAPLLHLYIREQMEYITIQRYVVEDSCDRLTIRLGVLNPRMNLPLLLA